MTCGKHMQWSHPHLCSIQTSVQARQYTVYSSVPGGYNFCTANNSAIGNDEFGNDEF